MKLKTPKNEHKRASDSRFKRTMRTVLTWAVILILLGLAGSHMFSMIVDTASIQRLLSMPEEAGSAGVTPVQSAFSGVVDWVVDYLYKLKLRARIELEYNNLKQENEQLIYDAMLVEDYKGNQLLLFASQWSIQWVTERNKGLVLAEFGGAKF